jgi:hypothetical protein
MNWPDVVVIALATLIFAVAGELPKLAQKLGSILSDHHRRLRHEDGRDRSVEWPDVSRWDLLAFFVFLCAVLLWWAQAL